MKKSGSLRIIYFCLLSLFSTTFFSCEGFLANNTFVDQLKSDIDYANATECKLIVYSDPAMGSFISSGEKSCKLKYTTDLQFTVNSSNYLFKSLEAVNYKNNSVSMADYVEFTTLEADSKNGIYKIQVKLLKESDEILIRPSCILLPKITEITPNFESSGCDQDTSIKIAFNKAVNAETFGNFSCLSVFADGVYVSDYFAAPEFSSDGKNLYLRPLGAQDNSKLLLAPDGNLETKNITVKVNLLGEQKDCDGISVIQNLEHIYKINRNYGNLKKVNINLQADENTGTFLTSTPLSCVVGFSVDVQFKVKKDLYVFKGLETSEGLEEKVKFTYESEADSEVQKVKITVLEDSGDLTVRPSCIELPKVTSCTPATGTQPYAFEPITITFNQPVENENLTSGQSLFIYGADNISLSYGSLDISDCFTAPVFNENKTCLTMKPLYEKVSAFMDEYNLPFIDITIKFGKNIVVEKEGITFSLNESASDLLVTYKQGKENEAPVLRDFYAAREELSLSSENPDIIKFSLKTYTGPDSFEKEDVVKNYLYEGKFFIYGKAYDSGTGVKKVTVTKTRTHFAEGDNSEVVSAQSQTITYTAESENAEFTNDGKGNYSFRIKEELNETGIYRYEVTVEDVCENSVSVTPFSVIYKNNFLAEQTCQFNHVNHPWHDTLHFFTYNYISGTERDNLNTIRLKYIPYRDGPSSTKVCNKYIYYQNCNFYITYKNKNNELVTEEFDSDHDYNAEHTLNVDSVNGLSFDIIFKYPLDGKEVFLDKVKYTVPGKAIYDRTEDGRIYFKSSQDGDEEFSATSYNIDDITNAWHENPDIVFYPYSYYKVDNINLFLTGEDSVAYTYEELMTLASGNESAEIGIDYYWIEKSQKEGCLDIKVSLPDNWKEKYDSVSLICDCSVLKTDDDLGNENAEMKTYMRSSTVTGGNEITVTLPTKMFYWYPKNFYTNAKGVTLTLNCEKGNALYSSSPVQVEIADYEKSYLDNLAPETCNLLYDSETEMLVTCTDFESGMQSAKAVINGKEYTLSPSQRTAASGYYDALIPFDVLYFGKNKLNVYFEDKAGNKGEKEFAFAYNYMTISEKGFLKKDESNWKLQIDDYPYWLPNINLVGLISKEKAKLVIEDFNSEDKSWDNTKTVTKQELTGGAVYRITDEYLVTNEAKFVKYSLVTDFSKNPKPEEIYLNYEIYYTQSDKSSGNYDVMYNNGNSKTSMVIGSDGPVLVQTLATSHSYEEVKDYPLAQWQRTARELGVEQINFTKENYTPRRYNIPLDDKKIKSGECYIVIAHYANNTVLMSEVMVK